MKKIKQTIKGLFLVMALGTANAQTPATELNYPKPQDPEEFGTSVAVYDHYALVAAENENDVHTNGKTNTYQGTIRLFRNNQFVRRYTYGNGALLWIGKKNATDIGQHCIAVGVPRTIINGKVSGSVVLANRLHDGDYHSTLNYALYPDPQDVEDGLDFGGSVATEGDWLAVGAKGRNNRTGGVFMFQRTGYWQWVKRGWIPTPQLPAGDNFGYSVKISGDQMIVGGNRSIYFYRLINGSWSFVQQFSSNWGFGQVDISGNYAVAATTSSQGISEVTVYRRSGSNSWSVFQTIAGPQRFGLDVAIHNQNLIISNDLRVYYYQLQDIYRLIGSMYIPATNPATGRLDKVRVGYDIDIHGDRIIASAINTNYSPGGNEGAVFTDFFYNGWANQNHLRAGSVAEIEESGSASAVSVYPNPSSTNVSLVAEGEILKVTAIDIHGEESSIAFMGKTLMVDGLKVGHYILSIETTLGVYTSKFVKL